MILEPPTKDAHLLSSWTAGLAWLCLAIGIQGATAPLLSPAPRPPTQRPGDEAIDVEIFQDPEPPPRTPPDLATPEAEPDLAIAPIPEIIPLLTPPEMPEITPLDPAPAPPVRPIPAAQPSPRPRPHDDARPAPAPPARQGGTHAVLTGTGGGRFPSPPYPTSARAARQEGSVRLLVTVEPSGIPSSVEVSASSGVPALDSAAGDTVRRRWRWPSGPLRKFIVPIRFVLQ